MFKRILIPLDFTDKNLPAVEAALKLAQANQSQVTLIHVIEKIDNLGSKDLKDFFEKLKENAEVKMGDWTRRFQDAGIQADFKVIFGSRAREIVSYAMDHEIDLIVLSSHRVSLENPMQGWGTVSYKVAILSQCPVLLVK